MLCLHSCKYSEKNKLCGRPPQYAPAQVCKLTFVLLILKVVSESCDVEYLGANFSPPRPLCSQLRPDVRDRQTSDAHHCLMPPKRGHNNSTPFSGPQFQVRIVCIVHDHKEQSIDRIFDEMADKWSSRWAANLKNFSFRSLGRDHFGWDSFSAIQPSPPLIAVTEVVWVCIGECQR